MIMLLANVLACISSVSATLATTESTVLPGGFDLSAISNPWLQALALMLGTFILEDTTAIAAGLLAHNGTISMPVAILGTGVGIYIGDLALYVMGAAAARGAKGTGWIRKRLPEARLAQLKGWLDRGSWKAVFLTRVISGTRLPVYLGAGFVGAGFAGFALWTGVAVALWTPLVVGGTALVGGSLIAWLEQHLGRSWTTWIVAAIVVFITLHLALKSSRHCAHFALSSGRIGRSMDRCFHGLRGNRCDSAARAHLQPPTHVGPTAALLANRNSRDSVRLMLSSPLPHFA
jgi:membrane protein DedA with SNARE-associated domain